jgi:hypothetical protein
VIQQTASTALDYPLDAAPTTSKRSRKTKPLSPIAIKNAKLRNIPFAMCDARGLYLLIKPNNSRLWRIKYKNKNGKASPGCGSR